MADGIRLTVRGIDELGDAFDEFLVQLADELRPGFVPEAQYRGMEGEPFTVEKIDLVTQRVGLT